MDDSSILEDHVSCVSPDSDEPLSGALSAKTTKREGASPQIEQTFAERLFHQRQSYHHTAPSRKQVRAFITGLFHLLFPHYDECRYESVEQFRGQFEELDNLLRRILLPLFRHSVEQKASKDEGLASNEDEYASTDKVAAAFIDAIPELHKQFVSDAEAIYAGDPAASSVDEVVICYPGFHAIAVYRVAHHFWQAGVPLFPRVLTEFAHKITGIDIHPGATIGARCCIDHGTGVVIGETTVLGDDVKIYQGVTLGALSVDKSQAAKKRHPTIENGCVIYSNATILGGETVVGAGSVIGGNVWLTRSVPPKSLVYRKSSVEVSTRNDA